MSDWVQWDALTPEERARLDDNVRRLRMGSEHKFDISTDDEESLMKFDEDLLAAILAAKQKKFALETGGGIWLPIDITRANAFHILRSVIRGVRELGGDVSVRGGLTRVAWSDTNTAA